MPSFNRFPLVESTIGLILFQICIICLCTTSVMTLNVSNNLSGCFQCMALMNKQWNHNLTNIAQCTGTSDDCGRCCEGFISMAEEGKCEPAEINVVNSGITVVQNGMTVVIQCHFSEDVDCTWKRRGNSFEISNRYAYLNNQNGKQTRNCSIKITEFDGSIDSGEFVCSNVANSTHESTSTPATVILSIGSVVIKVKENDKNALIPLDGNVIIACPFVKPVDCDWRRNNNNMEINGRYKFVNNKNGQETNDCSIIIDNFHDIDVGTWDCKSMGDSTESAIRSTNVQLIKVEGPSLVKFPQNSSVLQGNNITVSCTFNAEVECQWQLNGSDPPFNRYQFTENNFQRRRNCSINIEVPSSHEDRIEVWKCNYRYSTNNSLSSNTAWITILQKTNASETIIKNCKTTSHPALTKNLGKEETIKITTEETTETIPYTPSAALKNVTATQITTAHLGRTIVVILVVVITLLAIGIAVFWLYRRRRILTPVENYELPEKVANDLSKDEANEDRGMLTDSRD